MITIYGINGYFRQELIFGIFSSQDNLGKLIFKGISGTNVTHACSICSGCHTDLKQMLLNSIDAF